MDILFYIILGSLAGGLMSLLIALAILRRRSGTDTIIFHLLAFAAGVLLSVSFLDLLPEAIEAWVESQEAGTQVLMVALVGFVVFFLIESVLQHFFSFGHTVDTPHHAEHHTTTPWILSLGDSVHNFLDGVAIGASFLVSIPLGISTSLAVAAHEIPGEIGDVSIMLHAGWSRRRVIVVNVLSALLSTVGGIVAFFAQSAIIPAMGPLLAFIAGMFIYIASVHVLPELSHMRASKGIAALIPSFLAGIALMMVLQRYLAA